MGVRVSRSWGPPIEAARRARRSAPSPGGVVERSSVVADLHGVGDGQRLAGKHVSLVEVLVLENLVVQHPHLAILDPAGAGAALTLAAGERCVESAVEQQV